jgi:hypothetical protein
VSSSYHTKFRRRYKKHSPIGDVETKLQQRITTDELFTIRWDVR